MQFVWWLPVIYVLAFWLYYERIMFAEESFLRQKFGETYQQWAATTPAFLPRFSQWRKPSLPFSWLNVLRREYSGLMIVILCHAGQEFFELLIMRPPRCLGSVSGRRCYSAAWRRISCCDGSTGTRSC